MTQDTGTDDAGTSAGAKSKSETDQFAAAIEGFALHSGGPLDQMVTRLSGLANAARTAPLRALCVALVGWGGLLIITLLSRTGSEVGPTGGFLQDVNAFARFAVGAPLLMLMDRKVDSQLRVYLGHFAEAPLLAPRAIPLAAQAVVEAIDRARGIVPGVCFVVLAFLTSFGGQFVEAAQLDSWRFVGTEGARTLSVAGWWAVLIAAPIFWFLLFRGLWRYLVWAMLLRKIAKLELRLVATHPDGNGGLGFLGRHPNVFSALVFAVAISLSGSVSQGLNAGWLTSTSYGWLLSLWIAMVIVLFALPLSAFSAPLGDLKRRTRFAAAARATVNRRAEEREVFGHNIVAQAAVDAEEAGSAPDASKIDEAAKKLSTFPFSRAAIVPLGAAALLPLLAAGATQLPIKELVQAAKRLLLL